MFPTTYEENEYPKFMFSFTNKNTLQAFEILNLT